MSKPKNKKFRNLLTASIILLLVQLSLTIIFPEHKALSLIWFTANALIVAAAILLIAALVSLAKTTTPTN